MLSYNLDSFESAKKLIGLCEKYKDQMDIDVICGRYIIDACSVLGVHSLIGHIVSIEPQTDDENLKSEFGEELEKIK